MPRVETVIRVEPLNVIAPPTVMLRPGEIALDPATEAARPGPKPENEDDRIRALAQSLASPLGQIVPCIVERKGDLYALIDGRRRRLAALSLDSDEHPFYLQCVVRESGTDNLRVAVQANLQRQGYNALQFAYLCAAVRAEHNWTGTKEVAEYLGVSRAQVQKHDKLLHKPEDMDEQTYRDLIGDIAAGNLRADTALWALTHVKPEDIPFVMTIAANLAQDEAGEQVETPPESGVNGLEAQGTIGGSPTTTEDELNAPAKPEPSPRKSKKSAEVPETAKDRPWMKEARKKRKERLAAAKVEKRHVKAAAKQTGSIKTDTPKARGRAAQPEHTAMQRTLPDLRKLFEVLKSNGYPDIMRNFISILGDQWWRGDATDKEVISHWSQIAVAVEMGEKIDRAKAKQEASKKAVASKKKSKSK